MACKSEKKQPHFNLVLLGKSGVGKSATGNTILGREAFISRKSNKSTTLKIQMENVTFEGVSVKVYDTPGFCNTQLTSKDVKNKCKRLISVDGIYTVFLLVIPIGRFTQEDRRTVEEIQGFLGKICLQNSWILFTRGDDLNQSGQSLDNFITQGTHLKEVVKKFDGRYHSFNNKAKNPDQVRQLLEAIKNSPINMRGPTKMAWTGKKQSASCNLFLLGKTGVGKSATGNSILGQSHFISTRSSKSLPQKTQKRSVVMDDLNIDVYDTPGLYRTGISNEDVLEEYRSLLPLADSVPSVFLLVLRPERLSQEDRMAITDIEAVLGDWFLQNTWIVFTRGDELEKEDLTIEDLLEETEELKEVLKRFQNRYHVFNNRAENSHQVSELMEQIQHAHMSIKCSLKMAWIMSGNTPLYFNMVLMGTHGVGKSATGNTILGKEVFKSGDCIIHSTTRTDKERVSVDDVVLDLYDTPGVFKPEEMHRDMTKFEICWLDPEGGHEDLLKFQTCWSYSLREHDFQTLKLDRSVPTAFILVLRADTFTSADQSIVEHLPECVLQKTWILFTRGDELERKNLTIEQSIGQNEGLKRVMQRFGKRYHVYNNQNQHSDQVRILIEKIKHGLLCKYSEAELLQTIPPDPEKDPLHIRIQLLGKPGAGKSTTGNTILGEERFKSHSSRHCFPEIHYVKQHSHVAGRSVSVVDTPAFSPEIDHIFDKFHYFFCVRHELRRNECHRRYHHHRQHQYMEYRSPKMRNGILLPSPGPHTFLYVVPLRNFTHCKDHFVQNLKKFGEEMRKFTIILFTHGDFLKGKSVNMLIQENWDLRWLVDQCGGRYHVFNNEDQSNRDQVKELMEKVDRIVEQNGGSYYSIRMFEEAERIRKEKEEERRRMEEEERRRMKEDRRRREEERRRKKKTCVVS